MNQIAAVHDGATLIQAKPAQQATRERAKAREHVDYIEYFRAVAILMIVIGHTCVLAWTHFADEDPTKSVSLINVIPTLINGGTAYFVFISGFLYRQVYMGRIGYGDFLRKKALYIGLPYLIVATPLALAEIGFGAFTVSVAKDGVAYGDSLFVDMVVLLTTGRMVNAFWYIPFVFIVFLASPLFDRFMRLNTLSRLGVLLAATALAFWVHRPADNLNPVHSLLYFANLYMFGMVFCEHRKAIMAFVTRPPVTALLAVLIVAIAVAQALWLNDTSNLERHWGDGWAPLGLDLMLVQKYVGIFLLCGVLARWGHHLGRPLKAIAANSFGLYFVHGVVIAILMRMPAPLSPHAGYPMVDLALYSLFVIAISFAGVMIIKALTGRYSRYIIGS